MSEPVIFYTNPMSRGQIARWALEETGAAYKTEVVEYGADMKAPAYLAINPMGKVPAIRHEGRVVTETAAHRGVRQDGSDQTAYRADYARHGLQDEGGDQCGRWLKAHKEQGG